MWFRRESSGQLKAGQTRPGSNARRDFAHLDVCLGVALHGISDATLVLEGFRRIAGSQAASRATLVTDRTSAGAPPLAMLLSRRASHMIHPRQTSQTRCTTFHHIPLESGRRTKGEEDRRCRFTIDDSRVSIHGSRYTPRESVAGSQTSPYRPGPNQQAWTKQIPHGPHRPTDSPRDARSTRGRAPCAVPRCPGFPRGSGPSPWRGSVQRGARSEERGLDEQ